MIYTPCNSVELVNPPCLPCIWYPLKYSFGKCYNGTFVCLRALVIVRITIWLFLASLLGTHNLASRLRNTNTGRGRRPSHRAGLPTLVAHAPRQWGPAGRAVPPLRVIFLMSRSRVGGGPDMYGVCRVGRYWVSDKNNLFLAETLLKLWFLLLFHLFGHHVTLHVGQTWGVRWVRIWWEKFSIIFAPCITCIWKRMQHGVANNLYFDLKYDTRASRWLCKL
jgi:hypothetical protein